MKKKFFTIIIILVGLAGCAQHSLYNWSEYSESMYAFYKTPTEKQNFIDALHSVITNNEESGTRVPPGIYAEYGYMMLSVGKSGEAVVYFTKEMNAWPESEVFMKTMIAAAKNNRSNENLNKTGKSGGADSVIRLKTGV
jgi:hypothetical protein